jgi:predicted O-methyltransferase YrrM
VVAAVADRVRLVVGPALETLPKLADERRDPFDLVFIDADKVNNASYVDWAIRLGRPGTVIVVDNVVRRGAITDAGSTDQAVVGTRAVLEMLATDERLDATALQTVSAKGYDGFALAVVR